jgi:hypothetical protein
MKCDKDRNCFYKLGDNCGYKRMRCLLDCNLEMNCCDCEEFYINFYRSCK